MRPGKGGSVIKTLPALLLGPHTPAHYNHHLKSWGTEHPPLVSSPGTPVLHPSFPLVRIPHQLQCALQNSPMGQPLSVKWRKILSIKCLKLSAFNNTMKTKEKTKELVYPAPERCASRVHMKVAFLSPCMVCMTFTHEGLYSDFTLTQYSHTDCFVFKENPTNMAKLHKSA